MGLLCDYFSAASDDAAAAVIDVLGGPRAASDTGSEVVELKGIEPFVVLGKLEELLTGLDYDSVTENLRWGHAVAVRHDGELLVVSLTDEVQAALATASEAELRGVALPWSQIEEFWGQGEPSDLAEILIELAALARLATARHERLYCWVSV
ncbi:hypothetical protein ACFYON_16365 [Micromonospora sp. NPDC005686]|uniref:Uncharacterized protein n=1 Tax=Micromonospora sp. HUAS YX12 TaxID=3156396 RepID=A0AAU7R0D7_9ACTN